MRGEDSPCASISKDGVIGLYVAVSSSMGLEECVCLPTVSVLLLLHASLPL